MTTTLAIYQALIEANVPAPAARRAAEALEADMTQHLATKQDLAHWGELTSHRIDALEARMDARFSAMSGEFDLKLRNLESRLETRIVTKLGALMTFLFAIAGAALALVR